MLISVGCSCLTCRRRKTRCSGERPLCLTCTKNGHQCLGFGEEYKTDPGENDEMKSRKGAINTNDQDDGGFKEGSQYRDECQVAKRGWTDEKEAVEQRLSKSPIFHRRSSPLSRKEGIGTYPTSIKTAADMEEIKPFGENAARSPVSSQWLSHQQQDYHSRQQTAPPVPPVTQLLHEDASASDNLSPGTRHTHNRRVPYFRYFGPTAIVPGFKQMVVSVRDRRRSTAGSYSGGSPLSTPSNVLGSSSHVESEVVVDELPAYDPGDPAPVHPLIINLVQTFFVHLGCNYPFLKQAKCLRLVREKRIEPILVDAICALSARFSDAPILNGGNGNTPRSDRGQVFAQRAKHATVDTFPAPSVGAVQAFLLMAYEGFGANQDSALWMYLGLAIRMAVDLGLQKRVGIKYQGEKDPWYTRHRSLTACASESPEEKKGDREDFLSIVEQQELEQERIDTFWAVFVLDRAISSGTGRPVTLREDDFELPFPSSSINAATGWPDPFPAFVEIIHLYGRVSDVLNKIHNIQDLSEDKWDKLIKMEGTLTRIYKGWDPRLQFNVTNFKSYLGLGQGTTFILLHFWFHTLFIVLHQPTLMTPFGDLRSELQLLSESRELSMSSAKTICDILAFADLMDAKSFIGNPFTSQPMYIAACAFLMESSVNASEAPSREVTPAAGERGKESRTRRANTKHSRHSLLASAASQNYQRCYTSLQHLHIYWGGVKYILTALDQKAKGIWDVETYTSEEYESTKLARRESIGSQLTRFECNTSPKMNGPPIAWSLAGTANSPSSSLTLMYQNISGAMVPEGPLQQNASTAGRGPSTPPGNMVYDPIRQSQPDRDMPSSMPKANTSAARASRRVLPRRLSDLTGPNMAAQHSARYDAVPNGAEATRMYVPTGCTPPGHYSVGYDAYDASPGSTLSNANGSASALGQSNAGHNVNFNTQDNQGMLYQAPLVMPMANLDAITFNSQDIDIEALGLQQPDLMTAWMDYIPGGVLGLFENQDMDRTQQRCGSNDGGGTSAGPSPVIPLTACNYGGSLQEEYGREGC